MRIEDPNPAVTNSIRILREWKFVLKYCFPISYNFRDLEDLNFILVHCELKLKYEKREEKLEESENNKTKNFWAIQSLGLDRIRILESRFA